MILKVEKGDIEILLKLSKSVPEIEKTLYFRNRQICHVRFRHSVGKASGGLNSLPCGPVLSLSSHPTFRGISPGLCNINQLSFSFYTGVWLVN